MVPALRYVTQVAPYRDGPAGVHGVLDQSALAMAQLAETAGLGFERVFDVSELDPRSFDDTGVLALFTIGETPWSTAQRRSLLESVRAGRTSVLAIHSATDACYGWDDYRLLVGARFDGHPWTQTSTLDVLVPDHPALAHLGATWRWYDEIYRFRALRPEATVLLAARSDELDAAATTDPEPEFGYPLSWCFTEGAGRVFSTALGHFPSAWESVEYLRHLAGGLSWVTGEA
ncbi:MAG: ThuA domain-containing protein [Acidimicrobiales bacterium]